MTPAASPRLAVRAVILHRDRLLLVNAMPKTKSDLMCVPGGGVERGSALPENLKREVFEETGLRIDVGAPCLVNEFHDPDSGFHQVDIYFRCTLAGSSKIDATWRDVENIVTDRRWVSRAEMAMLRIKPDSLAAVAWQDRDAPFYDPLEPLIV